MPVNPCLSTITDNYNNCNIITVNPKNVRDLRPFFFFFFLFCCLYHSQIPVCKHKIEPAFSVQMSPPPPETCGGASLHNSEVELVNRKETCAEKHPHRFQGVVGTFGLKKLVLFYAYAMRTSREVGKKGKSFAVS